MVNVRMRNSLMYTSIGSFIVFIILSFVPFVSAQYVPTPTPFHRACTGVSCSNVPGSGSNSCTPAGASCSQTPGGSGSSACGPYSFTATCTCSGPCCPGTCSNGVACGSSQTISGCTDQTPQNRPTVSSVTQPDGGATIQTRYVTVNWTFNDTGNGCGKAWGYNCGGNSISFRLQIDNNSSFSSPEVDAQGISSAARSYTTTAADGVLRNNTTYYARVCATNAGQNCSASRSFVKQAYPGGSYDGGVGEYDPDAIPPFVDNGASANTGTQVTMTPDTSSGLTADCSETKTGTPTRLTQYSCAVTLDNVNSDPDPTQCLRLNTTNYNTGLYTGVCFNNSGACDSNTCINIDFDANGGTSTTGTKNLYYALDPDASYYKLKNVSFQARGQVTSLFPVTILPYDSDDTDSNYLLIGDSAANFDELGAALTPQDSNLGNGLPSRKGWENENYTAVTQLSYDRYNEYIKSRKDANIITNLNQLKEKVINRWEGDLVINASDIPNFETKNMVLVVTGTISFNVSEFKPANAHTGFLAKTINLYGDTDFLTEANGLFMGDTINFGTSNIPLKIVGNVISTKNQIDPRARSRDENRQPSFFLVFSPDLYINLFEYISTATYEWKQIQ